jgi:hypothetical protein
LNVHRLPFPHFPTAHLQLPFSPPNFQGPDRWIVCPSLNCLN